MDYRVGDILECTALLSMLEGTLEKHELGKINKEYEERVVTRGDLYKITHIIDDLIYANEEPRTYHDVVYDGFITTWEEQLDKNFICKRVDRLRKLRKLRKK